MNIDFDDNGNLYPYQKNVLTTEFLQEKFVVNFPLSESRLFLFENLKSTVQIYTSS